MRELEALAGRCEAATGADRELDAAIFFRIHPNWAVRVGKAAFSVKQPISGNGYISIEGRGFMFGDQVPTYTASIDAAMPLVPEGAGLTISRYWIAASKEPVWSAEIATGGIPTNPRQVFDCYDAATPALALCAAALRARAAMGEG